MTRSTLTIGALALAALIPSLSIIASTEAAARRPAGGLPAPPMGTYGVWQNMPTQSGGSIAIRAMNWYNIIHHGRRFR